jgi:subfamily B ATP-binding cassette protein HlyB/CyaB
MTTPPEAPGLNDPGLIALVMLLRFHGIGADPAQVRHQCGAAAIGPADMIRCAKEFGVKAREVKSSWDRLAGTPLPAIAVLKDGGFLLLGKVGDDKAVVQSS